MIDDSHMPGPGPSAVVSRRGALRIGAVLAGSLVLGSCASSPTAPAAGPTSPTTIGPTDPGSPRPRRTAVPPGTV